MAKKAKLHEILAVEGDLHATTTKVMAEAVVTFAKKPDHFQGQVRKVTMLDENRQGENEVSEKALVTTVARKCDYIQTALARYYDALLRKEATNQEARANLEVDDELSVPDLPATFLLGMESRLRALRDVYEVIPTLPPGLKWEKAPEQGPHTFSCESAPSFKTEKTARHKVLYDATKEHPAQLEKWFEDVPIGRIEVTQFSGMITPALKSEVLGRIDKLIRAVKRARQRANDREIVDRRIGKEILAWINKPLMKDE